MKNKKNMRLTRRSYRRKLIMFGVSIFMSLALSATGFAAWVISKDSQKTAGGQVEIGAVTEASIEITNITFIKDKNKPEETTQEAETFIFEPLAEDENGRVRYDGESNPENLDVEFTWTVKNFQIVGDLFVEFKIPETVYAAMTTENQWLALPEEFVFADAPVDVDIKNEAGDTIATEKYRVATYTIQDIEAGKRITDTRTNDPMLNYTVIKDGEVITQVEFAMKIAFSWGEAFGGMNPGLYYDDPETEGYDVEPDDIKKVLNEFKATLHGIEYNDAFEAMSEEDKAAAYEAKPINKFYILINANVA